MGLILSLVLLEMGLRLGGFVLSSIQAFENSKSGKQKDAYHILCLGESTTVGQYPRFLEQVLNQRNIGVHFKVIDKGKTGINTLFILSRVESYLDEYHPNMVVAMMGINDQYIKYYQDILEYRTWIFQHCRAYRFGRILFMNLSHKLREQDIYDPNRKNLVRKAKPEDLEKKKFLKKAIERNPENDFAYAEFGRLYREQGELSQAEDSYRKAIEINPKNGWARVALGDLYQEQGKLSQAEASFKKAIEINLKNDMAYVALGDLYRNHGTSFQSENILKKAIEINPQNNMAYVALGNLYREHGKLSQAEDLFKKAIELDPKNDKAYFALGYLYQDQGNLSREEYSFKKALALNPKNDDIYIELGVLYRLQKNESSKAEDLYKKAIEINPQHDRACLALGDHYREQGKFSQAEDFISKAIKINPKNSGAYFLLGVLYQEQRKFPETENMFKKTLELNPKSERALVAMALLYEETGKPKLAQESAKKAEQLRSGDQSTVTTYNYQKLKKILDRKGIQLVCVQYPVRNVASLKRIFEKDKGVIFVDNERVFKEAVKQSSYRAYFRDMFGGDFGHCTQRGNKLLAQNIADVVLKEAFNK